jgi:hypothetical protein
LSKSNKKPSEDFSRRVLKLYTYLHKISVSGTLPSHIFLKFANKVSHFSPLFCFNLDELGFVYQTILVAVFIHYLVYLYNIY